MYVPWLLLVLFFCMPRWQQQTAAKVHPYRQHSNLHKSVYGHFLRQ